MARRWLQGSAPPAAPQKRKRGARQSADSPPSLLLTPGRSVVLDHHRYAPQERCGYAFVKCTAGGIELYLLLLAYFLLTPPPGGLQDNPCRPTAVRHPRGLVKTAQTSVPNGADTHLRRFYHDIWGKSQKRFLLRLEARHGSDQGTQERIQQSDPRPHQERNGEAPHRQVRETGGMKRTRLAVAAS